MSAMHRLKAYFGMVPAEELDEYALDHRGYDEYYEYYDTEFDDPRARPRSTGRPAPRRRPDDGLTGPRPPYDTGGDQAGLAAGRAPRRSGWTPDGDSRPVRGSLAMESARMREPARDLGSRRQGRAEEDGHPLARIVTLHPRNYNEARPIGEQYRTGTPVIMNLTEMDDADAKRLVDFAAGLAFALRGDIDKVTNKVFLISPPNVEVSAEDKRRIAEGSFFNQS